VRNGSGGSFKKGELNATSTDNEKLEGADKMKSIGPHKAFEGKASVKLLLYQTWLTHRAGLPYAWGAKFWRGTQA